MAAITLASASARTVTGKLPIRPSLRIFRMLHPWVGLSFGLLLVTAGVSEAASVRRSALDRSMLPALAQPQTVQTEFSAAGPADLCRRGSTSVDC